MSEIKTKINEADIEKFLQGSDPQQYIVAVEAGYSDGKVQLIVNDPESGKRIEEHKYKPFLWFKEEITQIMYEGKRMKIQEAATKAGVKITRLKVSDNLGHTPIRMENGYKFMATCSKSYNDLVYFFKNGGVDVFGQEYRKYFVMFSPTEQFLIQSGKRLFKGMEDYNDVHRLQFDLETEGLFANKHAIFQIGVRDNRGKEIVLETLGNDGYEKRASEKENIEKFFKIIEIIKPDIITGYNSESFDWPFLFERAERLGVSIPDLAITLNKTSKIKRKPSTVKLGGETEIYNQTNMWGYNIIDISHAVRRAMAINSEIKGWGLKYITQYSEIAKPNRVYVPGDKINLTWADKINDYAFNETNGDWYIVTEKKPLKEGYVIKKGDFIVQRYLCDDLWETEQIDNIFNQASFLIGKMLPTTFQRSSTMGTAGQWKLIMAAWSYENNLAIPETQTKLDFTGGLARLLEVGYAKNVVKLDYAALYPKTQITHQIFPELDISGVMEGMLTYVVDTRDKYKFLTNKEKKIYEKLENKLRDEKEKLSEGELVDLEKQISEHKALSNLYDKKQLPLKILANSWFGSYGAPYIFNWGDTDSAEETTCRGRQYLRLMVKHFTEKHGFRALVGDTDGFNFSFPDNVSDIKYLAKGTHWKTTENAGVELSGLDAVLAEFNENYMEGRMGLDIDDICYSTINFARKNYANDIIKNGKHKIKLVGNSVKSKKMSVYIEDFLGKAIRMLLDGDGHSFIQYYQEYVDKIYNYQIPLVKIASKAKVKLNVSDYKKKANMVNVKGNPLPKQAHMELAIKDGIDVTLGDTLYYINTGTAKSHGDLKTEKNKTTGISTVVLNSKLIPPEVVEKDFEKIKELEMLKKALNSLADDENTTRVEFENRIEEINNELYTDEYNVARYLDAFNKKVKPLLVCFNPEIRDKITLDIVKVKDKVTKLTTEKLKDRLIFTKSECELVSGKPMKPGDQDSYEDLMRMEDKEIKFWSRVSKIPNNMEAEEFYILEADYIERMRIARLEAIEFEKNKLDDIFKRLEIKDINLFAETGSVPTEVFIMCDLDSDSGMFVSRKLHVPLCSITDVWKYDAEAIERDKYYQLTKCETLDSRYEQYLEYVMERKVLTGETETTKVTDLSTKDLKEISKLAKKKANEVIIPKPVVKKKKLSEGDSEDDEEEEDEDGELIRNDEVIQLDDEIDDTQGDIPDGYTLYKHANVVRSPEEVTNDIIDAMNAMDVYKQNQKRIEKEAQDAMLQYQKERLYSKTGITIEEQDKTFEENKKKEESKDEWGF
jgi:DNA polymerase elongation subunit (family B)